MHRLLPGSFRPPSSEGQSVSTPGSGLCMMCPRVGAGWPEIHEFRMALHLGFFQTRWLSLTLVCFGPCVRQSVGYQEARCSGILVLLCLSL